MIQLRNPFGLHDHVDGRDKPGHDGCGALISRRRLSPGAGDPVTRLHRACKEIERRQRNRGDFALKVVLLDSDQVENDPPRREIAEAIGRESGIDVIWQSPCHEAFLLRHFEEFEDQRPATSREIGLMMRRVWPDYEKAMT